MKNNKGFSILELIVSFSLTMVIVIVLFEIIVYMKELYEKSITQTELINRQNLIADYIYTDITDNNPYNISVCGNNCISFTYTDGQTKQLTWDSIAGTVTYGNYTMSLIKNSNFDQTLSLTDYNGNTLECVKIGNNSIIGIEGVNSYVSIHIPITTPLFSEKDFGLNIFYTYDSNITTVNLPISDSY